MDAKPESKKSTVHKRMCSFPIGLHKWAERETKTIAKTTGREPNFSGYLVSLILGDKMKKDAERRAARMARQAN